MAYTAAAMLIGTVISDPTQPGSGVMAMYWIIAVPMLGGMLWHAFHQVRHSAFHALVGVTLGIAVAVGNLNAATGSAPERAVGFGVLSGLGWYAATRILEQHPGLLPGWDGGPRTLRRLMMIGLGFGVVLGAVNLVLPVLGGSTLVVTDVPRAVISALEPAIHEEVVFHFFPLAWWVAWRGSLPTSRWGRLGLYAFLVVPHDLLHFPDMITTDPMNAMFGALYTSLLFGVPLVYLNRRRGVQAAMTTHWTIDAVRFGVGM
ncbi:hypothetical protein [Cellulomonas sp. NPDC089187]|uniref:hypothetical protein n=1 Tax=Cellulomonas sp. NPDC089187 TaxID=3154970 RepID=UPI00341CD3E0